MKNTNTINNTNNTPVTYNYPPRSAEEFLDAINMERGDIDRNWTIMNTWTLEQRFSYYKQCACCPKEERRSPWEAVIERCIEKFCLGKEYEVFYNLSDEMEPVAVVASKRKKDGTYPKGTINAMAYHPEKGLIDPFNGRYHITARTIICVGQPKYRFEEDPLRILRAIRFALKMDFEINFCTEMEMFKQADSIENYIFKRKNYV